MKTRYRLLAVMGLALGLSGFSHAADIGVSVSIGQPGFYGRIDLGPMSPPPLIYREPVIVERVRVPVAPVYLRVQPGHERKWRHYCHYYEACGRPVYFVRGDWYERHYVPYYRQHWDHGRGHWREERREHWREERREDRWDERGEGRRGDHHDGHGRGHDHGHRDWR